MRGVNAYTYLALVKGFVMAGNRAILCHIDYNRSKIPQLITTDLFLCFISDKKLPIGCIGINSQSICLSRNQPSPASPNTRTSLHYFQYLGGVIDDCGGGGLH